jgi:hypothetical protein
MLYIPPCQTAPTEENKMQITFTELEASRTAMRTGTDNLLASLGISRREFGTQSDAEILFAMADKFTAENKSVSAVLTTLKLATTARELEQATAASLAGFGAAHAERIDAERTVSPEAWALAASWQ